MIDRYDPDQVLNYPPNKCLDSDAGSLQNVLGLPSRSFGFFYALFVARAYLLPSPMTRSFSTFRARYLTSESLWPHYRWEIHDAGRDSGRAADITSFSDDHPAQRA